jgi:hypothetical protein
LVTNILLFKLLLNIPLLINISMKNIISRYRNILEKYNYVRKADSIDNYWFDLSYNKLTNYIKKTNGNLYIIIFGSEEISNDF